MGDCGLHAGWFPVTRILLGREVTCLLVAPPHLWAGTADGLFRIEPGQWVPAFAVFGSVSALARDGDQIWIGKRDGVSILNRNTLSLRTFTSEELGLKRSSGTLRFAVEGGLVWADNEQEGLLKYDRAGDVWSKPVSIPGTRDPAHLIDLIDGQVRRKYISATSCVIGRPSWTNAQCASLRPSLRGISRVITGCGIGK